MTCPQLDPVEIENRISAIEMALRGDLKGNSGALQNLIRLMNDVYNNPDGVKHRVALLEVWKASREDRFAGAVWVIRSGWAVLGGAVVWILHHVPAIHKLFVP